MIGHETRRRSHRDFVLVPVLRPKAGARNRNRQDDAPFDYDYEHEHVGKR